MAFARARVASSSAHLSWTSCACVAARKGGRGDARGCLAGLEGHNTDDDRSIDRSRRLRSRVEAVDIDRMERATRRLRRRLRPRLLSARGRVDRVHGAFDRRRAGRAPVARRRRRCERAGVRGVSRRLGTRAVGARVRVTEWDYRTCSSAARTDTGVFEVRARARVSLERETCECAARNGHLECLKYARERRVSLGREDVRSAA